jgi:mRNA interferase HigB
MEQSKAVRGAWSMHVISRRKLLESGETYPDSVKPLDTWYRIAKKALWRNFNEVQWSYPYASLAGECVVFNIGGNKYRLITSIDYASHMPARSSEETHQFRGKIWVLHVLTHADYSKGKWKKDCGC